MGVYLNSKRPCTVYQKAAESTYFVDKTAMLAELIPIVEKNGDSVDGVPVSEKDSRYICITRPRRFGKTVMACMIASFFGKGADSRNIFEKLVIGSSDRFESHLNQHNVIYITFNEVPKNCVSDEQYISRIENKMIDDLKRDFPNAKINQDDAVWDVLNNLYELEDSVEFMFVLDEWDFIYHQEFAADKDKMAFTKFLSTLLKDQPYVEMAYMTGILPIAKHSSGSELNMFFEFSMAAREKYSRYFGFTDEEVDELYRRYLKMENKQGITRQGLELWYDGYQTVTGKRMYNPRSVVGALVFNQLGSYWTSSGPYDEIYTYVKNDIDNIKEDIALLMGKASIPANVEEYASTSMELATKDEIYSAMVVYGFLTYSEGYVSIPNKELMDKFADMIRQKPAFGYINRLAAESGRMLEATKKGDTETMVEILERVHNTESPLIRYNSEAERSKVITFVYLQAREYYDIRQEDKSGVGYVDYIFYPYKKEDDGIIIELKVDDTADSVIQQIKDRQYMLNFNGKLGEEPRCTGRIIAVGIAYGRKDEKKRHKCKVEILREKLSGEKL